MEMTRLQNYLKEKYLGSFEVTKTASSWQTNRMKSNYIEAFINPSKKEMLDASKQGESFGADPSGVNIRFTLDMKKKKVYAWSPNITHQTFFDSMKQLGYGSSPYGRWLTGTASMRAGKFTMTASDAGVGPMLTKYKPEDFAWADKYINVTDFIKREYKWSQRPSKNKP